MKFKVILVCTLLLFGVAANTFAGSKDKAEKHPGYVDFEAMDILGDREAKIEVYLKANMIELMSKFVKEEDPDMYNMLNKLMLVRVLVFDVDYDLADEFAAVSKKTVKELDQKGWERIVRVTEGDERVYVYIKPSDDFEVIQGIAVIALEDDEAVFVNIVGDISPDDVSRMGDYFDIRELNGVEYHKSRKSRD